MYNAEANRKTGIVSEPAPIPDAALRQLEAAAGK